MILVVSQSGPAHESYEHEQDQPEAGLEMAAGQWGPLAITSPRDFISLISHHPLIL